MLGAIKDFPKQFDWKPEIGNAGELFAYQKIIVAGMGGSALAADILKMILEDIEITVHRDYGLPEAVLRKQGTREVLIIASSYSGNTEETIDAFLEAKKRGLPVAAVTTGGKLLELAEEHKAPYILLPADGIQPRMATGYSILALLKLMYEEERMKEIKTLAKKLNAERAETEGKALTVALQGKVPVIYSSRKNFAIARNWKIKFNETAKIPAFANYFPELNHNEMTGFDARSNTMELSEKFHFIFLKDSADHPRINKRAAVLENLLQKKGFGTSEAGIEGEGSFERVFRTLLVADWAAYYLAKHYHVDPENVPMVEEFKDLIK
ncbi:MAG: Bifunctional phosphoglucose/phosphomannose isomerase [Candidatus Giovannonibacteria bacterium GW2011_GWA2_44_13b]|uniref:Bifunctional phosphoglucose/phosphomannose isomerase n=2 Tax=Candidatus Giovannoniibacteriota TaxID=1752738 RepID=A0A0G1JYB5_9BACT|nr:MAG: Bifunctional phosphoglucose/phosphomannose isomerase [Candidatus Giovannonibacteria bacterium GW2011_GWA2_44_13b]OGF82949.1 MAG: bifunctional phosphoglucose/phosphomannose isomerase [Candidatus Giovannonibacteria bacterium RIFCSPLOWO2_01_FULL_44_16]